MGASKHLQSMLLFVQSNVQSILFFSDSCTNTDRNARYKVADIKVIQSHLQQLDQHSCSKDWKSRRSWYQFAGSGRITGVSSPQHAQCCKNSTTPALNWESNKLSTTLSSSCSSWSIVVLFICCYKAKLSILYYNLLNHGMGR